MKTVGTGYWSIKKEKLKRKFEILTEKDLCFSEGREIEMIEILSNKLGISKQEMLRIIITL